jgi:uncharacterized protein DUF4257
MSEITLTRSERFSVFVTISVFVALVAVAWVSASNGWVLALALSVGGLGGLIHELAQSRGKILFFSKQDDGIYLGTIAGVVLGAVAGVLTVRGFLLEGSETTFEGTVKVTYEVFLAGLALKGVVEAAGGSPVPLKH